MDSTFADLTCAECHHALRYHYVDRALTVPGACEHGRSSTGDSACGCKHFLDDPVNHPSHYTSHPSGIECIQITEHFSFCIGNAIKYLWRADLKNGIEDLEKAKWYIEREIQRRQHAN